MSHLLRTGATLAAMAMIVTGCFARSSGSQWALPADLPADQTYQIRNQGYSLLYELVSGEKDVAKLLLIKKESAGVNALIKDISDAAAGIQRQLEAFALEDSRLNLRRSDLPFIENKTRESIGGARGKQLLVSGGAKFEARLLLTQVEALTYGSHLAETLGETETIAKRKNYLTQTARQLRALSERAEDAILSRFVR